MSGKSIGADASRYIARSLSARPAESIRITDPGRAVVWLVDLRRGSFEEAQGGVGFGAVVLETGVKALEGFRVMKPQDGSP